MLRSNWPSWGVQFDLYIFWGNSFCLWFFHKHCSWHLKWCNCILAALFFIFNCSLIWKMHKIRICYYFKIFMSPAVVKQKTKNSMIWVRERTTDRATAACRRSDCQLVRIEGATWSAWRLPPAVFPVSRQESLLFYQVAPQLYSRGWVDPVPDPLPFSFFFFRKSGSAGNRTRASGSVVKNSDH
jgi:hypothetical protein